MKYWAYCLIFRDRHPVRSVFYCIFAEPKAPIKILAGPPIWIF